MITFQVWVFDKTKDGDPKGFPLELIVESKDGKGMRLAAAIEAMDQDLKRDAPFGGKQAFLLLVYATKWLLQI